MLPGAEGYEFRPINMDVFGETIERVMTKRRTRRMLDSSDRSRAKDPRDVSYIVGLKVRSENAF